MDSQKIKSMFTCLLRWFITPTYMLWFVYQNAMYNDGQFNQTKNMKIEFE